MSEIKITGNKGKPVEEGHSNLDSIDSLDVSDVIAKLEKDVGIPNADQEYLKEVQRELEDTQQEVVNKEEEVRQEEDRLTKLAKEYGWDPKGPKPVEEFVKYALEALPKRGKILTKQQKELDAKNNELFKLKSMLNELSSHLKKQTMRTLQVQHKMAVREGDEELAAELEQELAKEQAHASIPEVVQDFLERYDHILSKPSNLQEREMAAWIRMHDAGLSQLGLPPEVHMQQLEQDLMEKFPSYFQEEVEEEIVQAVDSGDSVSNRVTSTNKERNFTLKDLTPQQKEVAKYLSDNGIMSTKEYIQQLKENGDI